MNNEHHYTTILDWTGAKEGGTVNYRGYSRHYQVSAEGKPVLDLSADPHFRGDPGKYNPEDLLVAALSGCHMLTYLALAARKGLIVTAYQDRASGTMREVGEGGHFTDVTLHPIVTIAAGQDAAMAEHLHDHAGRDCFIAASMKFPVHHQVEIRVAAK